MRCYGDYFDAREHGCTENTMAGRVASALNALARDSFDESTAASLQGFIDDYFGNPSEDFSGMQ